MRRITRWQGISQEIGLAATAPPTARALLRQPERLGERLVGGDPAGGYAQQRLPHLELEIGAADGEPHRVAARRPRLEAARRPCLEAARRPRLEDARRNRGGGVRVLVEACGGPAALEFGADGLNVGVGVAVGETEGADAAPGPSDEAGAEGARMHAPGDVDPGPAALEGAGAHRLVGDEEVVQARGAGKPRVVSRIEDRGGGFELRPGIVQRQELAEALGRDARPAPEQALEMMGVEAGLARHLVEPRLIAEVFLQIEDRRFDAGVVARVLRDVRG